MLLVETRIVAHVGCVSFLLERQVVRLTAPRLDANTNQSVRTLLGNKILFEQLHICEKHILIVWKHVCPILFRRRLYRCLHQLKVSRLIRIGTDVKMIPKVTSAVLKTTLTRLNDLKLPCWVIGSQKSMLVRHRRGRTNHQIFTALALVYETSEGLVFFFKNELMCSTLRIPTLDLIAAKRL